jgi:4-hydroxybenzoate polyprenyltransferase
MERHADALIADAKSTNWVDRFAPAFLKPYLKLGRFDRPIGYWLLLWPCWWSVALAAREAPSGWQFAVTQGSGWPDPVLLVLFYVGAVAMRAAGCAYNDIVDRDIDALVERTALRPLASGQISLTQAILFLIAMALSGLAVLLTFNTFAIVLGIASLGIVALYPHMKRITHYPQIVLGLAFNWGALLGWAVLTGGLHPAPVVLYLAGIVWTLGYDTIYAHQDKEDDLLVGVKSLAIKLGQGTRRWLAFFYVVTVAGIGAAGWLTDIGALFYAGYDHRRSTVHLAGHQDRYRLTGRLPGQIPLKPSVGRVGIPGNRRRQHPLEQVATYLGCVNLL